MDKNKVLIVSTTDNMIWQFLIPHIKMLEARGNSVECVCAKTGFWFDELRDKYGFLMHELNFTRFPLTIKNFVALKKLYKLQRKNHYNVVYCQQPVGGLMGRLLAKKFKIPAIYTAHGFHFFDGCSLKRKLVYKTAEKYLSKYTDVLITINDEDFDAANKMHAKSVYKINGIGMEIGKYDDNSDSKEKIKSSLGIMKSEFVITTIAEFIPRKNYDTMIRVAKALKEKGLKFKFLICGRGQEENRIKKLIKKLNLESEIKLLGYRKDINRILTCTDVFLLASYQEGLTLSVIEAMSFGLPCVVSNVRGNRDLIDDGLGGFLALPRDVDRFAYCIDEIFHSKKMRDKMSKYNLKKSKQYSIDFVNSQLNSIYNDCDFKI